MTKIPYTKREIGKKKTPPDELIKYVRAQWAFSIYFTELNKYLSDSSSGNILPYFLRLGNSRVHIVIKIIRVRNAIYIYCRINRVNLKTSIVYDA